MKTRIASVLLTLLAVAVLPGCTTVKENNLYSMWEQRAYGAYGMPVPAAAPVNPFMSAITPYRPALNNPLDTLSTSLLQVSHPVFGQETRFISQYYSLQ